MSTLWTDLLFLHGHLTDWSLLRRLSLPPAPAPAAPAPAPAAIESPGQSCTALAAAT